jgi:hypothetical protein
MAEQHLSQRSLGKIVPEYDHRNQPTGRYVCVSCHHWNCWHPKGQPCDIKGCECVYGQS